MYDNHNPEYIQNEAGWHTAYEEEYNNLVLSTEANYERWRNPSGELKVWHKVGEGTIYLEHGSNLKEISYMNFFTLTSGTFYESEKSTIVIEDLETSDKIFGELTFIGGEDGTIAITGVITVVEEGYMLFTSKREFQIHGVQTSDGTP